MVYICVYAFLCVCVCLCSWLRSELLWQRMRFWRLLACSRTIVLRRRWCHQFVLVPSDTGRGAEGWTDKLAIRLLVFLYTHLCFCSAPAKQVTEGFTVNWIHTNLPSHNNKDAERGSTKVKQFIYARIWVTVVQHALQGEAKNAVIFLSISFIYNNSILTLVKIQ